MDVVELLMILQRKVVEMLIIQIDVVELHTIQWKVVKLLILQIEIIQIDANSTYWLECRCVIGSSSYIILNQPFIRCTISTIYIPIFDIKY